MSNYKGYTDHYLDTTGLNCPLPILKLRNSLKSMNIGETICMEGTDPGIPEDVTAFSTQVEYVELKHIGENNKIFQVVVKLIKKKPTSTNTTKTSPFFPIFKDDDVCIFRYMPVERLFQMFETKKFVFVKPKLWKDPNDNILSLVTSLIDDTTKINLSGLSNGFYAQCWSQAESCDAFWNNHATLDFGVKISSTSNKLRECLMRNQKDNVFIGQVKYRSSEEIKSEIKALNNNWTNALNDISSIAETLLLKRKEFSYEKEVRVIYLKTHSSPDYQYPDLLFNKIENINELIDSIEFSPKMHPCIFEAFKDKLKKIGFNNDISKSELYEPFNEVI